MPLVRGLCASMKMNNMLWQWLWLHLTRNVASPRFAGAKRAQHVFPFAAKGVQRTFSVELRQVCSGTARPPTLKGKETSGVVAKPLTKPKSTVIEVLKLRVDKRYIVEVDWKVAINYPKRPFSARVEQQLGASPLPFLTLGASPSRLAMGMILSPG